jgi:hypothetical protein
MARQLPDAKSGAGRESNRDVVSHRIRHNRHEPAGQRHASAAPPLDRLDAAVLLHEWLHELPRGRRDARGRRLPDLRLHTPGPLTS